MTLAVELTRLAADARDTAVARERERLAQRRAAELSVGAAAISRSLERLRDVEHLDGFLEGVLRELVAATGAVSAGIQLYDADRSELVTRLLLLRGERLALETDPRVAEFGEPVPIAGQFLWREMGSRELLWIDLARPDARLTGRYHAWHARHAHRYLAVIPMLLGQELVGLIGIAYDDGAVEPPDGLQELFRHLAQHAALAVRLGRLAVEARVAAVERERARAAESQAAELSRANAALTRSGARLTDLDHLDGFLGSVVEELTHAVGAVTGCVFLHDPDTDLLSTRIVISRGRRVDIHAEPIAAAFLEPFRASGHPIWESLRRQEVHWFDYTRAPGGISGRFTAWHAAQRHSFACAVPMLHGDAPIGFVGLGFDAAAEAPSEQRVELCRSLAQHAALAIRLDELADHARDAAVLGERTRLARDVHDTLAQGLTAIVLQLQAAEGNVAAAERARYVEQAIEIARRSLLDARRAVYALRHEHADGADLGTVLDASVKFLFARTQTRVSVGIEGVRRRLEPGVEDELLRIAQEAATNALKYAEASAFAVHLRFRDAGVDLLLTDDGRGFAARAPIEGFGLRGMRERAARLGAAFELRTAPGRGTTIAVRWNEAEPPALTGAP